MIYDFILHKLSYATKTTRKNEFDFKLISKAVECTVHIHSYIYFPFQCCGKSIPFIGYMNCYCVHDFSKADLIFGKFCCCHQFVNNVIFVASTLE